MTRKFALGILAFASMLTLAASGKRINLVPRYVPGATLRYRIESTTTTTGKTTTPIVNPEGGTHSTLMVHLVVRLDVLSAPSGGAGAARLRATYEKSSAESQSDVLDPAQPSVSDEYARLKGESVEFTIAPSGQLVDIKGLEEAPADRSLGRSALSWLGALSTTGGFPADGVEIGQKWKSERPVEGVPLAGLAWRVESVYLRDEPCDSSPSSGRSAPASKAPLESCAVILSRFEITRSGAAHGDATPEDYLRNGLRASGSWTGSGEGLNYISLASGLLVRSTETSDQQMDYKITSATTGSSIARNAQVHSQSEISLDSAPSVSPTK
jgi:hypothetical protein